MKANEVFLDLLGYDLEGLRGCQFEFVLTRSSSIFFQIYFQALIKLVGRIEEMHLSMRSANGDEVPVLLSAVRRERRGRLILDCFVYRERTASTKS